jgi:abscisic-aldehyde oxidase
LAVAFLFSFLYPVNKDTLKPVKAVHLNCSVPSGTNGNPNCGPDAHVDASLKINNMKSGSYSNDRILEYSNQIIEINKDYLPVGIPAKKVGAELQASGTDFTVLLNNHSLLRHIKRHLAPTIHMVLKMLPPSRICLI